MFTVIAIVSGFCALQGLADTFIILGMAFDSPEAKQLNKDIFECIYYNALVTSCALAKVDGETEQSHCAFGISGHLGHCIRSVVHAYTLPACYLLGSSFSLLWLNLAVAAIGCEPLYF